MYFNEQIYKEYLSIQTEVYSLFPTMNFYGTQQKSTLLFPRTNSIDKYDEKTKKFVDT